MSKLTIAKTLILLGSWASDADHRALMAADAVSTVRAAEKARLYRGMLESIREALVANVTPLVVIRSTTKRAAKAVSSDRLGDTRTRSASLGAASSRTAKGRSTLSALSFWALHSQAVEAIRAEHGERWGVVAPFGHTELVTVPARWLKFRTERGTILTWRRDHRIPGARYWPTGELPCELTVTPDYPRHPFQPVDRYGAMRLQVCRQIRARRLFYEAGSDSWEACSEHARGLLVELRGMKRTPRVVITPTVRDAAWHTAHGYVWNGKDWVSGVGYHAPQPFPDPADDLELAEAAD